jgi:hypothetical protein
MAGLMNYMLSIIYARIYWSKHPGCKLTIIDSRRHIRFNSVD